jgi:hypothetical protein
METLTTITGNNQAKVSQLPKLLIMTKEINDTALAHIFENTGLNFVKGHWNYKAQPTSSNQIARLFLTYNFKTRYFDNWDMKNTLCLKLDHHVGFDVDAICGKCREYNHVHSGDMKHEEMLACYRLTQRER